MSDNEDILSLVRKRNLEQNQASVKRNEPKIRLLVFRLGNEWYGIEAQQVREISRLSDVTRVPLTPGHVLGVMNLRGDITAVIDIRPTLGVSPTPLEESARIIVVNQDGLEAGILAEAVVEMIEAARNALQPPLLAVETERGRYASSILQQREDRLIIVLNLPALLDALKV